MSVFQSKELLLAEEEKIKAAELDVAKAETLVAPVINRKPSDAAIEQIDIAAGVTQNALSSAIKSIDAHTRTPCRC